LDFADSQNTIHEAEVKRCNEADALALVTKPVNQHFNHNKSTTVASVRPSSTHHLNPQQSLPKANSPAVRYPQRPAPHFASLIPQRDTSLKQHRHEAASVLSTLKQYNSWDDVPLEVINVMYQKHEYLCSQEALEVETDEAVLDSDCYDAWVSEEYTRSEDADKLRYAQVFALTEDSKKADWQQCKWCWVCGLNNHLYLACPFRDFRTEHDLSPFKVKFQPDIMIDLILTASRENGYLSKESGNTYITLKETIMRERAEFLNNKKKALSDGSFKQMSNNGRYNNHYQPPANA
jgi:hypothetical protein